MKVFNYGSNMLAERLRAENRAPGAVGIGIGIVRGRSLRFHKRSTDGSGKCDIFMTGRTEDAVHGALVEIPIEEMDQLRKAEGVGKGYEEMLVMVEIGTGTPIPAVAFVATTDAIDESLRPYSWYHELVVAGAEQNALPEIYVAQLRSIVATSDPVPDRRTKREAEEALRAYANNKATVSGASHSLPDSPIAPLWNGFAGAPFQLAPERKEELQALIADRNIQFNLDDETHELRFEGANLFQSLGLVFVGLRGLERLWAHAYGAIFVYRQFQASGFQPIHLESTEEGRRTGRLLRWALEGELEGNTTLWPTDLPRPQATPPDDQGQLTNELFFGIGGFAVLHEIGHIAQNHSGSDLPRDTLYRYEFEADEWAYDWIMSRWRDYADDSRVAQKRIMLIASMFAIMAAQQVYVPRKVKTAKHPNTIDRLLRFLVKHANEDNALRVGLGWSVPCTTIHLHLSQRLSQALPQLDSFRTYLNTIRSVLDDPLAE